MPEKNISYNSRNPKKVIIVNYSMESLSYQFPQLWALFPYEYKQINSLNQFKRKFKK